MRKAEKKNEPKESPRDKLSRILEFPTEVVWSVPHIELSGNKDILLENCKGIIDYKTEEIRVNGGKYMIKITGRELNLKSMQNESMLISGFIQTVEFIT